MKITQTIRAYNSIRESILKKDLLPGHPLTEIELSEKLQMSRTPVREALTRLEVEGMIHSPNGKGYIVKLHTSSDIRQAYEFGECLEAMAVYIIAGKNKDNADTITLMEECVEAMINHTDEDVWAEADDRFHEILRDSCGNEFIRSSLIRVYGIVHYTRVLITKIMLNKSKSAMDHKLTLEMIKKGDAEGARASMIGHWQRIRNEVVLILE